MTKQALNFANLCKGGNPDTIFQLLGFQSNSVVTELKFEFEAKDEYDLAYRLSLGIM